MSVAAPVASPVESPPGSDGGALEAAGMFRLLDVLLTGADRDAILSFRPTPTQNARFRRLRAAAERGDLSPVEAAELQAHRDVGQFAAYAKGWVLARDDGAGR